LEFDLAQKSKTETADSQHVACPRHVHFVPKADINRRQCPLCARSRHCASVDHLVSAGKERRRDVETKGPRGLEVNGQLVFGWRLDRQVSRFLALENAIDITGGAPVGVDYVRPVSDQAAASSAARGP